MLEVVIIHIVMAQKCMIKMEMLLVDVKEQKVIILAVMHGLIHIVITLVILILLPTILPLIMKDLILVHKINRYFYLFIFLSKIFYISTSFDKI